MITKKNPICLIPGFCQCFLPRIVVGVSTTHRFVCHILLSALSITLSASQVWGKNTSLCRPWADSPRFPLVMLLDTFETLQTYVYTQQQHTYSITSSALLLYTTTAMIIREGVPADTVAHPRHQKKRTLIVHENSNHRRSTGR